MAVTETSMEAYELLRKGKHLNAGQDAVLAILAEIGPCPDARICEALNQKEAAAMKPRSARRKWTINCVTPRRGELVEMGLISCRGIYKTPYSRVAVRVWGLCRDDRKVPFELVTKTGRCGTALRQVRSCGQKVSCDKEKPSAHQGNSSDAVSQAARLLGSQPRRRRAKVTEPTLFDVCPQNAGALYD